LCISILGCEKKATRATNVSIQYQDGSVWIWNNTEKTMYWRDSVWYENEPIAIEEPSEIYYIHNGQRINIAIDIVISDRKIESTQKKCIGSFSGGDSIYIKYVWYAWVKTLILDPPWAYYEYEWRRGEARTNFIVDGDMLVMFNYNETFIVMKKD